MSASHILTFSALSQSELKRKTCNRQEEREKLHVPLNLIGQKDGYLTVIG